MLRVVIDVDAAGADAQGVKEALAMDLEKYGDACVVEVTEYSPRQLSLLYERNGVKTYG